MESLEASALLILSGDDVAARRDQTRNHVGEREAQAISVRLCHCTNNNLPTKRKGVTAVVRLAALDCLLAVARPLRKLIGPVHPVDARIYVVLVACADF